MRSENEIRTALALFDSLNAEDVAAGVPLRDLFQYGLYVGKQLGLSWTLGQTPSSLLTSNFDYEDWVRERSEARFSEKPPATED